VRAPRGISAAGDRRAPVAELLVLGPAAAVHGLGSAGPACGALTGVTTRRSRVTCPACRALGEAVSMLPGSVPDPAPREATA
jgi:hypothetical protein